MRRLTLLLLILPLFLACQAVQVDPTISFSPLIAEGSFTVEFDGNSYTVDYTGGAVEAIVKHRLAPSGPACVGYVDVSLTDVSGECRLDLSFRPDFGGGLVLKAAKFHARETIYQEDFPIGAIPCSQFADMGKYKKGFKPAVFSYAGGDAFLVTKLLMQPGAGLKTATLRGYSLRPKGTLKMKMGGRIFSLSLDNLTAYGDIKSTGEVSLMCSQSYLSPSDAVLKDVNKRSPTFGQELDFSTDFEGKYLVVLMGAGWCASCITQTEYLEAIKRDLELQGRDDFVMVTINDKSAAAPSQQEMMAGKDPDKKASFPVVQGTGEFGWTSFLDCKNRKGKKNDGFVFAPNGQFIRKHEGKGTVYMNVWEDDVRAGLGAKLEDLDSCECKEVKNNASKVHHVLCE